MSTIFLWSSTIYVSPSGQDTNNGSLSKPLASIQKALQLAEHDAAIKEIILSKGTYDSKVSIVPNKLAPEEELTIRAALDEEGIAQKVTFDGGYHIKGAEAVNGMKGIFKTKIPKSFNIFRDRPDMAELNTRIRYRRVADLKAVEHFPASFEIIDRDLYFHTSDHEAPSQHRIVGNFVSTGIEITRNNVTIKDINLEHQGFRIMSNHVTLKNCRSWNVRRVAFYIGASASNTKILNCLAEDVGGAYYSEGKYTTIIGCRGFRRKGPFESHYRQEKGSGIQLYSPAQYGVIKNNLLVGFRTGIFIKAPIQHVIIENNTVVDGISYGIGCFRWFPKSIMRNNIVHGFKQAFFVDSLLKKTHSSIEGVNIENNALWASKSSEQEKLSLELPLKAGVGYRNMKVNPCFVSIKNEDFRLLPESPLARLLPGGKHLGAMPVAKDTKDQEAPTLELELGQPALRLSRTIKKYFAKDPWNAGLPPGSFSAPHLESSTTENDGLNRWIIKGDKTHMILSANDNFFKVNKMKLKMGKNPWGKAQDFKVMVPIEIPKGKDELVVQVKVVDQAGNWSEVKQLTLFKAKHALHLVSDPVLFKNRYGMILQFKTNIPANVKVVWGFSKDCKNTAVEQRDTTRYWVANDGGEWIYEKYEVKQNHHFCILPETPNQKIYYRIVMDNGVGKTQRSQVFETTLGGAFQKYFVDAKQLGRGDGSQNNPFANIQTAIDRALPGDEIILKEGIYDRPFYLSHGGHKNAPLDIRAAKGAKVIFDGKKEDEFLFRIINANHIVIQGIEMRWFKKSAMLISGSENIHVDQCRIWNKHWGRSWPNGEGFMITHSPGFKLTNSLLCAMNGGGILFFSPGFEISNCTGNFLLHQGVRLVYSSKDSVFKNNSFTFTGNDHIAAIELKDDWESFYCDYNNYAAMLRRISLRRPPQDEDILWENIPGNRSWIKAAKHLNILLLGWGRRSQEYKAFNLDEWKKMSKKDANSIYKFPNYVDPIKRNYYLKSNSPNLNAGENGVHIGAYGLSG